MLEADGTKEATKVKNFENFKRILYKNVHKYGDSWEIFTGGLQPEAALGFSFCQIFVRPFPI